MKCIEIHPTDDHFHPAPFVEFFETGELQDEDLTLVCVQKQPARPDIGYVPAYLYELRAEGKRAGEISLRIGMTDSLYYGGQIGYAVEPEFRRRGYAGRACKLLLPLIRRHGYQKILITNDHANTASRRVCEKLGARLVRVAELPQWHDLYKEGQRHECIWVWNVV
ncbi:MAG: GNAT family N-acetyltransferase [Clostridia bacterium]|nr:GNAT family N-acetyltransferase [Clostridia bacterium]